MQLNYQQLMVAFAIPPRVCKKPGPDTARHTPGLNRKHKMKKKRKREKESEHKEHLINNQQKLERC